MSDDIYSLTGECEMLRGQLAAAQAENARLREELLDYSAVADSDKYWHGKYTALTAAVNALLAAVDAFYPERDGYGDVMNAAGAVREAIGGGK